MPQYLLNEETTRDLSSVSHAHTPRGSAAPGSG